MSNSVDPDETAHYKPSHQDLCCLQKLIIIACGNERVKNNESPVAPTAASLRDIITFNFIMCIVVLRLCRIFIMFFFLFFFVFFFRKNEAWCFM